MKRNRGIFIGFLAVSAICVWFIVNNPQGRSWAETYSPEGKNPYDTYVFTHSLPSLFPASVIVPAGRPSPEQLDSISDGKPAACVYVAKFFLMDEAGREALFRFVERGNSLFLAVEVMPEQLLDSLGLHSRRTYSSQKHILSCSELGEREYDFEEEEAMAFVLDSNRFVGTTLGECKEKGNADFVAVPYGDGWFYLNLNPRAFTNYYMLDSLCGDYSYKALSYMPDGGRLIVWGDFRESDDAMGSTPFRVLLQHAALRWALFLLIFGGVFYMIFAVRREQRPMSVVIPYENRMLDFVASVSSLYYKQKDHYRIAEKRIDFFLERVRSHYRIRTDVLDDGFVKLLAENSGVDESQVKWLTGLIKKVRASRSVSQEGLREMVRGMEMFPFYVNENKDKEYGK